MDKRISAEQIFNRVQRPGEILSHHISPGRPLNKTSEEARFARLTEQGDKKNPYELK